MMTKKSNLKNSSINFEFCTDLEIDKLFEDIEFMNLKNLIGNIELLEFEKRISPMNEQRKYNGKNKKNNIRENGINTE